MGVKFSLKRWNNSMGEGGNVIAVKHEQNGWFDLGKWCRLLLRALRCLLVDLSLGNFASSSLHGLCCMVISP